MPIEKKKRGRPKGGGRGKGTLIGVRFPRQELNPLDTWIANQPDPQPSRPEAIRRLVEHALAHPPKPKR
jgi:hypothetical protein